MPIVNRGVVYSLIVVVIVLLLGIVALLEVDHSRQKRLEDTTIDLQRRLLQQQGKVAKLQQMLADCDSLRTRCDSIPTGIEPPTSWNDSLNLEP